MQNDIQECEITLECIKTLFFVRKIGTLMSCIRLLMHEDGSHNQITISENKIRAQKAIEEICGKST